jgi:surface carbohydrate biosynthesis protein
MWNRQSVLRPVTVDRPSTLIIPVENQVRELDSKLLLSCIAAERGFPVVLGSRTYIHFQAASIPRGVYLAKSMRSLSDRMFVIMRQLGHEIVAWDEEGLVRAPDPQYYQRRLSAVALREVEALFAWGPDNARAFRDFPGYTGVPIYVTGNPRTDMLRGELRHYFDPEVEAIRRRFERLLLINTNFGHANHYLASLRNAAASSDSPDDYFTGFAAYRTELFNHFREMVPALGKAFPHLTIVVRPHPIESHEPWQELAQQLDNVVVIHDGNVVPWLMASEMLVQNGCTTAIEASLLGIPAISYQPVSIERFDIPLINALTHNTRSLDELRGIVSAIANREVGVRDSPERKQMIGQHIAALNGPLAAERIVDHLTKAGYRDRRPPKPQLFRYAVGWVHTALRTCVKKIKGRRPNHRSSRKYHSHRFPDIGVAQLQERVNRLGRQLGRFDGIRVRQISDHIFAIHQEP